MGEKNGKTRNDRNHDATTIQDREVDVLYQKLGDRWFASSLIDDEIFIGSIVPDDLKARDAGK